jgi:hypothetical protein
MTMYDTQRYGRDPSFNPATGAFDAADPSGIPHFRMAANIIGAGGARKLARPVFWEAIGTLSGRRYRDSFMPGSGALSFTVMQTMRNVQVCETAEASTNPAGLNLLGIPNGSNCEAFPETPIAKPSCRPGKLGPGLRPANCPAEDVKSSKPVAPKTPPKPQRVAPNATVTGSVTPR